MIGGPMPSILTQREKRVLQLRHGLVDRQVRTVDEVARRFGITAARIQQIEAKAMRKLRSLPPDSDLRAHLT